MAIVFGKDGLVGNQRQTVVELPPVKFRTTPELLLRYGPICGNTFLCGPDGMRAGDGVNAAALPLA